MNIPSNPVIEKFIKPDQLINCDISFFEQVQVRFTEAQIQDMECDFTTFAKTTSLRDDLKKAISDAVTLDLDFDAITEVLAAFQGKEIGEIGTKKLKADSKNILVDIKNGYSFQEQKMYGFANHDISRMAIYDEQGKFVYDRSLKEHERQANMFTMGKTGTEE